MTALGREGVIAPACLAVRCPKASTARQSPVLQYREFDMKRLIVTDNFAKLTDRFNHTSYNTFCGLYERRCKVLDEKNNQSYDDEPVLIVKDYTTEWATALLKDTPEAKQSFWKKVEDDGDDRYKYPGIMFVQIFPESAIKEAPPDRRYDFVMKQREYERVAVSGGIVTEIADFLFLAEEAQGKTVYSGALPAATISPLMTHALTSVGIPSITKAHEASIEDSDGTPVNVRDNDAVEAIRELIAVTKEPKPVFLVDPPKGGTLKPQDCPVEGKGGFWLPQKEYAKRVGKKSESLTAYRKISEGARWSSDRTWGDTKKGEHIFKKIEPGNPNSKYLYFVRLQ